jgi:hypothetical protein
MTETDEELQSNSNLYGQVYVVIFSFVAGAIGLVLVA